MVQGVYLKKRVTKSVDRRRISLNQYKKGKRKCTETERDKRRIREKIEQTLKDKASSS
ncbi:hypothetical protein NEHOM01_2251 [Nematocida homosporus]|uniref:uncharacterized protein n=1 Tax=Nematocida homosporus TaxID=1912981 RepID=UPI00221F0D7B|nr:uncharacterized protein NEHOM01_2251 [Nematocida homosporus]KAI5187536.1 hypothetical protein NEHOM01_2251 [Nematocida homosporus]